MWYHVRRGVDRLYQVVRHDDRDGLAVVMHFVVLQQGPSTRLDSRQNLVTYARLWADEARRHGARPALYMVWPFRNQPDGFELCARSYRDAAEASHSLILPAGEAWSAAILHEPDAPPLYQSDGLHQTPAGSYLAALIIARGLTEGQSEHARLVVS